MPRQDFRIGFNSPGQATPQYTIDSSAIASLSPLIHAATAQFAAAFLPAATPPAAIDIAATFVTTEVVRRLNSAIANRPITPKARISCYCDGDCDAIDAVEITKQDVRVLFPKTVGIGVTNVPLVGDVKLTITFDVTVVEGPHATESCGDDGKRRTRKYFVEWQGELEIDAAWLSITGPVPPFATTEHWMVTDCCEGGGWFSDREASTTSEG